MPTKKQSCVYVDRRTFDLIGGCSEGCSRAVEAFARALAVSEPKNLPREGWSLLFGVLMLQQPDSQWDARRLAEVLTEENTYNRDLVADHFASEEDFERFIERIAHLPHMQVQYIIHACWWATRCPEVTSRDNWWTLPFRVQYIKRNPMRPTRGKAAKKTT